LSAYFKSKITRDFAAQYSMFTYTSTLVYMFCVQDRTDMDEVR